MELMESTGIGVFLGEIMQALEVWIILVWLKRELKHFLKIIYFYIIKSKED